MKRAAIAIVAVLLATLAAGDGAAQTVRETGRVHQDWREACENAPGAKDVCFLFQRVKQDGRSAANVTIGYKDGVPGPVFVINLPLGEILLPDGLRIETDRDVDGWAPFRFCDARGCHVEMEIEPELLAALKEGAEAALVVRSLKGEPVRLPFSLLGLTAGLEAVRR